MPKYANRGRRFRRRNLENGFTLIELLVVIAIIAILAAILFPVFASAKAKARQTMCLSNQKQIGIAILACTQDYAEVLPLSNNYFVARTRHGGGANYLLGDGHAKWFKSPTPGYTLVGATYTPIPAVVGVACRKSLYPNAGAWFRED